MRRAAAKFPCLCNFHECAGFLFQVFPLKKAVPLLCAVLLSLCCAEASAGAALGVQAGGVPSVPSDIPPAAELALTLKFDTLPFVFSSRICMEDLRLSSAALVMDMWVGNPVTGSSIVHFFYGPGLAFSYAPRREESGGTRPWQFFAGPRFVVGLNAFVEDNIELYGQTAMELGIVAGESVMPAFRSHFPVEVGIRFWF